MGSRVGGGLCRFTVTYLAANAAWIWSGMAQYSFNERCNWTSKKRYGVVLELFHLVNLYIIYVRWP